MSASLVCSVPSSCCAQVATGMQSSSPCEAAQRSGEQPQSRGDWEHASGEASGGRGTPARTALAGRRPAWSVGAPAAPSARSASVSATPSRGSREASARPQFDLGEEAAARSGALPQPRHAWRGGARSPPPPSEAYEPPDEQAERGVDRQVRRFTAVAGLQLSTDRTHPVVRRRRGRGRARRGFQPLRRR